MTRLALPPICDRAAARLFQPDICDAIGTEPVALDASKVERIGLAMLQVLVSAARSEGGVTIADPSDAFIQTLRLTGLETALGTKADR